MIAQGPAPVNRFAAVAGTEVQGNIWESDFALCVFGGRLPRQGIRYLLPLNQIFPAAKWNENDTQRREREAQKREQPPEWAATRVSQNYSAVMDLCLSQSS